MPAFTLGQAFQRRDPQTLGSDGEGQADQMALAVDVNGARTALPLIAALFHPVRLSFRGGHRGASYGCPLALHDQSRSLVARLRASGRCSRVHGTSRFGRDRFKEEACGTTAPVEKKV